MDAVTVSPKYQVVIPKRVRNSLNIQPGQKMHKGGRLGFIRFGSRTDLIMPAHVDVKVEVGQKVTGGETIIGQL